MKPHPTEGAWGRGPGVKPSLQSLLPPMGGMTLGVEYTQMPWASSPQIENGGNGFSRPERGPLFDLTWCDQIGSSGEANSYK